MLVYQATKAEFMDDVDRDLIADHITEAFERKIHRANPLGAESWRNSMQDMYRVLNCEAIPGGCAWRSSSGFCTRAAGATSCSPVARRGYAERSDEARYSNSMTTSISTGIRPGNDPMPTADRA